MGATRTIATLDLVAGNPALDFANTINSRLVPEHDYLANFADLVAWMAHAGVATSGSHMAASDTATRDPEAAERALRRAHRLREAIYRTFSAIVAGDPPPEADVRRVLRAYGTAVGRASVARELGSRLRWPLTAAPSQLLDPIAYAAGALLVSDARPRIKECPGCGWLFIDQSRNSSRRWCDMQTCGSRDKMRRYHRSRQSRSSEPS